jgi:hypothetical protein
MRWQRTVDITPHKYLCGYCGDIVAATKGYGTDDAPGGRNAHVCICPSCTKPTYIHFSERVPAATPGNLVKSLPPDVDALYIEARRAAGIGAHTASVLACRKLLMNIAVSKGAAVGQPFIVYIEHLAKGGYVPPDGREWVDHIRTTGNEATHEIRVMTESESTELISFAEMLLKFVFEFPARVPRKT